MSELFFPQQNEIIPDFSETARYLGYKKSYPPEQKVTQLINECISEQHKILRPKACFQTFDLTVRDNSISFADFTFNSVDLGRNLKDCTKVTLLAATIGPEADAQIRKAGFTDSVKAGIFQAAGAMFVEQLVNLVNDRIDGQQKEAGFSSRPRYSPGYGDVPLTIQKEFFRLLPVSKIGLTLMDTFVMAPEKSVTAFVGHFKS